MPRDLRGGAPRHPPRATGPLPTPTATRHLAHNVWVPGAGGGQGRSEPRVHTDEGDNTVLLLETDYRLYITFYLRNIRNGTETTVLALYGTAS